MLDEIKKIQGINNTTFDTIINMWIDAGKQELINIGINSDLVNGTNGTTTDSLIKTTIICFVLSQMDVVNNEMYKNSYMLLKDTLRHVGAYI